MVLLSLKPSGGSSSMSREAVFNGPVQVRKMEEDGTEQVLLPVYGRPF